MSLRPVPLPATPPRRGRRGRGGLTPTSDRRGRGASSAGSTPRGGGAGFGRIGDAGFSASDKVAMLLASQRAELRGVYRDLAENLETQKQAFVAWRQGTAASAAVGRLVESAERFRRDRLLEPAMAVLGYELPRSVARRARAAAAPRHAACVCCTAAWRGWLSVWRTVIMQRGVITMAVGRVQRHARGAAARRRASALRVERDELGGAAAEMIRAACVGWWHRQRCAILSIQPS